MSIFRLLYREILHRKLNFGMGLLAIVLAAALFVAVLTMGRAAERETRRLMLTMGFNLLVVPEGTNMADFWAKDFAERDMPEEYVHRLAKMPTIAADHFVAKLQKKVRMRVETAEAEPAGAEGKPRVRMYLPDESGNADRAGRGRRHSVLLTGVLPEMARGAKAPMGVKVKPGTCHVGSELAAGLGIQEGDTIEVQGKPLKVVHVWRESGSKEDICLYAQLHDVQQILKMEGRINVILAVGCRCTGDRLATIRDQVKQALPDTKVTELRSIALARAETRRMVERNVALLVPGVLAVCGVWVFALALINVLERRQEIGILRAHGIGAGRIAWLFLGKAVLVGLLGAGLGFVLGTWLAQQLGPTTYKITHAKIKPIYGLLAWSLAVAPAVAALASFLPTMIAVTQDPAVTLTEE